MGKTPEEFKRMLDRAMEQGINFLDMYTSNPIFRNHLGVKMSMNCGIPRITRVDSSI